MKKILIKEIKYKIKKRKRKLYYLIKYLRYKANK
jgi:hypothetical protein